MLKNVTNPSAVVINRVPARRLWVEGDWLISDGVILTMHHARDSEDKSPRLPGSLKLEQCQ